MCDLITVLLLGHLVLDSNVKKSASCWKKITKDFHDFQDAILSIKENDKMKELIELERFWFIYLQSCFPGTWSNSQVKKTAFHREVKTFMTFRV